MPTEYYLVNGVKTAVEGSDIHSTEDFADPEGNIDVRELFATRKRMIAEGRIALKPVEEFAESDAARLKELLDSGPVPIRIENCPDI